MLLKVYEYRLDIYAGFPSSFLLVVWRLWHNPWIKFIVWSLGRALLAGPHVMIDLLNEQTRLH